MSSDAEEGPSQTKLQCKGVAGQDNLTSTDDCRFQEVSKKVDRCQNEKEKLGRKYANLETNLQRSLIEVKLYQFKYGVDAKICEKVAMFKEVQEQHSDSVTKQQQIFRDMYEALDREIIQRISKQKKKNKEKLVQQRAEEEAKFKEEMQRRLESEKGDETLKFQLEEMKKKLVELEDKNSNLGEKLSVATECIGALKAKQNDLIQKNEEYETENYYLTSVLTAKNEAERNKAKERRQVYGRVSNSLQESYNSLWRIESRRFNNRSAGGMSTRDELALLDDRMRSSPPVMTSPTCTNPTNPSMDYHTSNAHVRKRDEETAFSRSPSQVETKSNAEEKRALKQEQEEEVEVLESPPPANEVEEAEHDQSEEAAPDEDDE